MWNHFDRYKFLFVLCLFICGSPRLQAQAGTVSDAEVAAQGMFIEAQREKLLGNFEKAEPLLREILEKDNANHVILYELAQVLSELNKLDEAIQMAEKAVRFEEQNIWYNQLLASLYDKNEEDRKASKVYEGLAQIEPRNQEFYYKWAFHLVRIQLIEEAIEVYNKLERQIGITPEITRRKHSLYYGMGDFKRAEKEIVKLTEAYPSNTDHLLILAEYYQSQQADKRANEIYKRILKIEPKNAKAALALQSGQSNSDPLAGMRPIFADPKVKIDLKVKQLIPYIQKVATTQDNDLAQSALQLAALLTEVHPKEAKAYAAYADLLNITGQQESAKVNYEKTLALDESVFTVWEQLLYIYLEQKDYDQLATYSENAIDLFPNQARFYLLNGIALLENGAIEDAKDMLQEALLIGGQDEQLKQDVEKQLSRIKQ